MAPSKSSGNSALKPKQGKNPSGKTQKQHKKNKVKSGIMPIFFVTPESQNSITNPAFHQHFPPLTHNKKPSTALN
jgi:hypothetical protein